MKIFYMIYFGVAAAFVLNAVSNALFAKSSLFKKATNILTAIVFAVLWPLALFSPKGRKVLLTNTTKF